MLADYLQNGLNCDRGKLCEEYFDRLMKIPMMRWTWRGFSFGIDYMKSLADNIETEEESDAVSELEKSVFVLKHIEDKTRMNLKNIF